MKLLNFSNTLKAPTRAPWISTLVTRKDSEELKSIKEECSKSVNTVFFTDRFYSLLDFKVYPIVINISDPNLYCRNLRNILALSIKS